MNALGRAKSFFKDDHFRFKRMVGRWLEGTAEMYPDSFADNLLKRWHKTAHKSGHASAFKEMRATTSKISNSGLAMSSDDSAITAKAKEMSEHCARLKEHGYFGLSDFVTRKGVQPPEIKAGVTMAGAVERMCCELWWRRQLRTHHKRWCEAAAIEFGSVGRGRSLYVSEDCLKSRKGQISRNNSTLCALVAHCLETGEQLRMDEVAEKSVSNPSIRKDEMMCRMVGLQEWARDAGHMCHFWTLTAPSRFHRFSTNRKTGQIFDNKNYDESTPRDAQRHLSTLWARTRSKLNREGVTVYGVRVAEPHHDGTPHWHLMMFGASEDLERASEIMRGYALQESPDEPGAQRRRFTVKKIKWEFDANGNVTRSPVSYIAKYISKHLDGSGMDGDTSDECERTPMSEAISRVDAWRSCWGIRQFQFIDSHAVTLWRELRRLEDAPEAEEFLPLFDAVNKTEEKGADWCAFMRELDQMPVRLAVEPCDKVNRYGEAAIERIIGVVDTSTGLFEKTRFKTWSIKQSAERVAPWSPVNNCTERKKVCSMGNEKNQAPPD